MDSFEFNKIAGALLFSLLLILGAKNLADHFFAVPEANPKAFEVAGVAEESAGGAAAPAAEVIEPLPNRLAKADVASGEKSAKKCQACHNLVEGAGTKIGPDLFHVVGRQVASAAGFNYSAAMKAKGGTWTFDELDQFITAPQTHVPGTLMTFPGIKKPQERADVIAYLNTLGSNLPLPKPEAAPAPVATPAAGAAPAASGAAAKPATAGAADKTPATTPATPAVAQKPAVTAAPAANTPPAAAPAATAKPAATAPAH